MLAEVHSRETVVVFGDAEEGEVVIKWKKWWYKIFQV